MAREKRPAHGDEPQQQEEMTVVVLKFKGGSQSLQKGFDAVSQAIASLGPAHHNSHRSVVQRQPAQLPPGNGQVLDAEPADLNGNGAGPGEDTGDAVDAEAAVSAKAKKAWEPRKYKFLTDFNLSPDGVPSLRQFCTDTNPQSENEKYLVVSAWLMQHGGADPFTPDHIYTCFQAMGSALGWKTQVDVMQPIRLMKSKKNLFANPDRGTWRLTQPGLDAAAAVGKA
jgi:hypothetical protein